MHETQWITVWKFHTRRFLFTLSYQPEEEGSVYLWNESEEVREKLASGELQEYVFRVRGYLDGLSIYDTYCGGCILPEPPAFRDHLGLAERSRNDKCNYGSYFAGMVREAVAETGQYILDHPTPILRQRGAKNDE